MVFRKRIFLAVFVVGLLPALIILAVSAVLLNSTIDRIGAAGIEKSFRSASVMTSDAEAAIGRLLQAVLSQSIRWEDDRDLGGWMEWNYIDLAYRVEGGRIVRFDLRPPITDSSDTGPDLPENPGLYHLIYDGRLYLCYSIRDSSALYGCGILMPMGYGERGRILAEALSVSASLGIYKSLSLELLAIATAIIIAVILLSGFFVSSIISGRLVKPLEELTGGARKLGAGDLDYRVKLSGGDEFSRLGESFNKMAARIKENQARLLEAERLAAWREVARRIAHEIRNPLTPITVELYRLRNRLAEGQDIVPEQAADSLDAISERIKALQDLSNHFSAFAREPELKMTKCNLADIIESIVALYSQHENVILKTEISDNIPLLDLDPQMMGRMLANLIKNSIEASPESSDIGIRAEKSVDSITIVIRDNGPGFPQEKLDRIDQPYLTSKKGGTGLGLAISKKIVQEHGGAIRFFNDGGAVVEIKLPIGS
jgi:nitrogen fixation/metabolism regulation signal transduction histidine kinase